MKLLAVTAIGALALVTAAPAMAGNPNETNNTATTDQGVPQRASNSQDQDGNVQDQNQTALNSRSYGQNQTANNDQNLQDQYQIALNDQESMDQGNLGPKDQASNRTAMNDQSGNRGLQDQDSSQAALNNQTTAQSDVDMGAIARNEPIDPNIQRMNKAAQEKAQALNSDRSDAGYPNNQRTNKAVQEQQQDLNSDRPDAGNPANVGNTNPPTEE